MKAVCIIPSRYASTRLPGKPLRMIAGETLVHRVYERALLAKVPEQVIVATDHEDIEKEVKAFGGHVVMTSVNHPTGTDRLAEVAAKFPQYDIIVNVQGDEPLIDPDVIDGLAKDLMDHEDLDMATVATPLRKEEYDDPSAVKVVVNRKGEALYFSRSLIPYPRHDFAEPPLKHVGISFWPMPKWNRLRWKRRNPWNSCGPWKWAIKSALFPSKPKISVLIQKQT